MIGGRLNGIVLLLLVPTFVAESIVYVRGGYNSAFWARPLGEKLDHIAAHRREWTWVAAVWLPILAVLSAGVLGFCFLLAAKGEPVLAGLAAGSYGIGAVAWLVAIAFQGVGVGTAADARSERGSVPAWLEPGWRFAGWLEIAFLVCTGLAYVALGVGILETGFPAIWMGWVAVSVGGASAIGVLAARQGFPQLAEIVPLVLGIALLVS